MGNILYSLRRIYYDNLSQHINLSSIITYFTIFILTWLVYKMFIKPFLSPLRQIPGLPYNPIFGNMNEALKGEAMECTIRWLKKYGSIVRYYFFFGGERIVVADPDIMKHILVTNGKNYVKPPGRIKFLRIMVGKDSVLMTEGSIHAYQRKLLNPAFKYGTIKEMIGTFGEHAIHLGDKWCADMEKQLDNNKVIEVPIYDHLARMTLDALGHCAFSYHFNSVDNPDHKVSLAFKRMLSGISLSWKFAIPFYEKLPTPDNLKFRRELSLIQNTVENVILQKRNLIQQAKTDKDRRAVSQDLLGMMMLAEDEEGNHMADQELRNQVLTFMLAGHETTATGMSWVLLQLARHPDVQDKVREEARRTLPSSGEPVTWEHIDGLKYLTCVIKETLRMFPPVPLTLRQALKDDRFGNYDIPAKSIILLAMGPMMRLDQYWDDPDTFKPVRFMEDKQESQNSNLYNFLPFLMGSRMCIGYKFALMEMRTVIAILLKNMQFSLLPNVE